MSQTNIQVPIEQRNHDEEVLKNRGVKYGDERFKSPGPVFMSSDDRPAPLVVHHGGPTVGGEAPDMLFGERKSTGEKTVMAGRRHADMQLNRGRNVGSTHLDMDARPHREQPITGAPVEGGITLPKDQ